MGDAATPALPDFTSQTASVYKANIDAGFAVADRLAWAFAPHEQDQGSPAPDMTVRLDAGAVFDGTTLTEVAAQSTGTLTAPTTNPRIDRVVIDEATGAVSVLTGTEAPSPVAPAITAGKLPIAQVALVVSQTSIVNADITDERNLGLLGLGFLANDDIDGLTEETIIDGAADFVPVFDTSAGVIRKAVPDNLASGFASGTVMLFHQSAAPTGWTKDVAATLDNAALRVVTSTAWASGKQGATAFDGVFGAGKTADNHTLTIAEMPSHNHTGNYYNATAGGVTAVRGTNAGSSPVTNNVPAQGGGGAHNHTLSLDLNYINMILASKD